MRPDPNFRWMLSKLAGMSEKFEFGAKNWIIGLSVVRHDLSYIHPIGLVQNSIPVGLVHVSQNYFLNFVV